MGIRMPLISQESHLETLVMLLQLTNISHLSKWVSLPRDHQIQRVNTPGENLYTQLEEWDNLSQTLSLNKEPVLQSSSNGLMEMVLDLRSMISSTISLKIQMEILRNSTKIPLTSLELQL